MFLNCSADINIKLFLPDVPEKPVLNGIVNENGTLFYYINDVKQYNLGLIEYEGNYYYVRSGGQLAVGTYHVWNGNGFVPDHTEHEFGTDGKML